MKHIGYEIKESLSDMRYCFVDPEEKCEDVLFFKTRRYFLKGDYQIIFTIKIKLIPVDELQALKYMSYLCLDL